MLTALGESSPNVFFLKPARGKTPEKIYGTASYRFEKETILIGHALSGCGTTSSLYGKGKLNIWKILSDYPNLGGTLL